MRQIGLSFHPIRGRSVADVVGTLWLDDRSFELRRLDWSYTGIEPAADAAGAGGHLTFGVLPSGVWVVTEWGLRMPVVDETLASTPSSGAAGLGSLRVRRQREHVVRIVEEVGGLVASVREDGRTVWSAQVHGATLRLTDAGSRTPLAGATVELRGTTQRSTSGSTGVVLLAGILPGRYSAEIVLPSLAALGVAYHADVVVLPDNREPIEIPVPSPAAVVGLACADQYAGTDRGILSGSVMANDGWPPSHRVQVRATARGEMRGIGSRGAASSVTSVWTQTDEAGRFTLCGLPWDVEVIVQAPGAPGGPGARLTLRREHPSRLDIRLNP